MTIIKVEINQQKNLISVYNNGKGIPVQIHKEHNIYIPELIFGNLLTSSNYNDSIKKITGGRNGFGAKLTNIFSRKFIIETVDTKNKKKYIQTFLKNMSEKLEPEITAINKDEEDDYTKITFEPDLKKFKMKDLEDDIVSLLKKRVYDSAGTTSHKISVYLNGKKIQIKSFKEYTEMYLNNKLFNNQIEYPKLFENPHSRWELMVTMADSQFQQVSFVNGISTTRGGTHVQHVIEQITQKIIEQISKKNKELKLKPNQIKQNLWIFLNCYIENPAFNSQTKEALTTQVSISQKFFI
jgi:DNA topoisomerase-2